jgi:thymidylate synthase
MHNELRDTYPELEIGSYNMFCNNIHIYERNFEVFNNMMNDYNNEEFEELHIMDIVDNSILDNFVFNKEFGN